MRRIFPFIFSVCLLVALPRGWANTLAQFQSSLGSVDVVLFDQDKPVTTQNFIRYVKSLLYQDMFIHRWEPGFVIQGGGYFTANRFSTNAIFGSIPTFGTITNEYSEGRIFSNTYGTLAMARMPGLTNSATSQWFFNLAANSSLDHEDGGFTVFGRVLRGTNVLNRFNNVSKTNGIFRINVGGALNHLPVLSTNATYNDLVYVEISLLTVRMRLMADGTREISWNSVSNVVNNIEFTTNLAAGWQLFGSTNGTGGTLSVIDSDSPLIQRFYRARLDY